MSLVALHNGGGVGVGKALNGGYGMLLDGSRETDEILKSAMRYDVLLGVARRAWAQNTGAIETITNEENVSVTLPNKASDELIEQVIKKRGKQ